MSVGGAVGLMAHNYSAGGHSLQLYNSAGTQVLYVDDSGNVYAAGGFNPSPIRVRDRSVATFTPRAAAPSVEDTGTAQLVGGVADVRLDPTFAQTIDPTTTYRVFLTPGGDTRGLFVQSKTLRDFIVRESQAGHSTVAFDYRIVATPLGQNGQRVSTSALTTSVGLPRALPHGLPSATRQTLPPIPKLLNLR
jgi:hypothetical protein